MRTPLSVVLPVPWLIVVAVTTAARTGDSDTVANSSANSTSSLEVKVSPRPSAYSPTETKAPPDTPKFKDRTSLNCSLLQPGQYRCLDPEIDPETQAAKNCTKERLVKVPCLPTEGIFCNLQTHTGLTVGFYKEVPCRWTNGKKFSTALLLSVFLGWLGIDRFYLGYPAIGLAKFCTFGFMFVGHLLDILLIAIQTVGPSDRSDYIVDYYGAGLFRINQDNYTYVRPPKYT
ncbi:TM2 domain-containing protein 1 [Lamellibrachia satsuma]|nr:TM2 domain-containing protein 1 [Lamellibrachia satsuma]